MCHGSLRWHRRERIRLRAPRGTSDFSPCLTSAALALPGRGPSLARAVSTYRSAATAAAIFGRLAAGDVWVLQPRYWDASDLVRWRIKAFAGSVRWSGCASNLTTTTLGHGGDPCVATPRCHCCMAPVEMSPRTKQFCVRQSGITAVSAPLAGAFCAALGLLERR